MNLKTIVCSNFLSIFNSIFLSIFASGIFWLFTFKISRTNIIFSDKLIKSKESEKSVYRIRIANIGYRDLIEVNIIAQLKIKLGETNEIYNLDISEGDYQKFIPVLPGMKTYRTRKLTNIKILKFYIPKFLQKELIGKVGFRSSKYKKYEDIQLDDIFRKYRSRFEITFYVFGSDSVTSTRKLFESPKYINNVIEFDASYDFKKADLQILDSKKKKEEKISQVHKRV